MSGKKNNLIFYGAVTILVLSVIVFVFIPASTGSSSGKNTVFGKWNGTPIEYVEGSYFVEQIQQLTDKAKEQGQAVNELSTYYIMQNAFNSAAVRMAVLDTLKSAGYTVPQSTINTALLPYYSDESGRYSARRYASVPESTRANLRSTLTEDMTVQRFVSDIFGSSEGLYGIKTSSKETDLVKTMASPERSFTYVSFPLSAYPRTEAAAWGSTKPELFVKHDLSLITVDSEEAAKKVASSLAKNEVSFDEAIATNSSKIGSNADGKLLNSYRSDLNKFFSDAKDLETVLALAKGAVSPIVKSGNTFVIVRCNEDPVQPDFTNDSVIDAVIAYMNLNERGKVEDYITAKAKEFVASARTDGFEAASLKAGLEEKTTSPFPVNYGSVKLLSAVPAETSTELAAAVKNDTFFKTAFSLAPDAVSEPVLLDSTVLVLKVAEEKALDPQYLDMLLAGYETFTGGLAQEAVTQSILTSKKLEDNVLNTYLKFSDTSL